MSDLQHQNNVGTLLDLAGLNEIDLVARRLLGGRTKQRDTAVQETLLHQGARSDRTGKAGNGNQVVTAAMAHAFVKTECQ